MKAVNLLVVALVVMIPLLMKAQSSSVTEIDELKAEMKAQQKLLQEQQAEIQTLKSALATQRRCWWTSFTVARIRKRWFLPFTVPSK
jgi:hypothetical protein